MPRTEGPSTVSVTLAQARAAFLAAQGFPAPKKASLQSVLERTGFIRTLGGVDVYLAARARVPRMRRAELDALVKSGGAKIIPAVRGCMYLVARQHVPASLCFASAVSRARAEKEQQKAGIHKGEVEKVANAALAVLKESGPLATDALRKAMPEGTVRSLGEPGKKLGITSPLPGALRRLELAGLIERTPQSGRLDTERYLWRAAAENPLAGAPGDGDPAALNAHLAEVFLGAAGLATLKDFAGWAGLSQRDGKAAFERLKLVTVDVEGRAETFHALASRRDLLEGADAVRDAVAFLPFADNVLELHGGPALLVDEEFHDLPVPSWGRSGATTLGASKHMELRSVVAEGRVGAVWEYDPDAKAIVWAPLGNLAPATLRRLDELAKETAAFLSEDVGHGRSFSLDTDDDLRERSAFVMKLAGGAPKAARKR